MKVSDFEYELPADRIAHDPIEPRDAARLLVHEIDSDATSHRLVRDLPEHLEPGDLLVVNDTRVVPARLRGRRASGGAIEVLVLGPAPRAGSFGGLSVRALAKPGKRIKLGEPFELEGGRLVGWAVERVRHPDGRLAAEWIVELADPMKRGLGLFELLEEFGRMPLPPYIRRDPQSDSRTALDRERYQTVFAREAGAVAAPTAGLHFTPALCAALDARGVERVAVTLHVGVGTFQAVDVEDVADHTMHAESFVLSDATAEAIARTRARGGRVIAVGTTSVRVLEACADETGGTDSRGGRGRVRAGAGETSIFITPGYEFRVVDALLTNFHLPRSTLLMLVSAFAGRDRVLRLYGEAIAGGYRFYSYGDAMFLTRRSAT